MEVVANDPLLGDSAIKFCIARIDHTLSSLSFDLMEVDNTSTTSGFLINLGIFPGNLVRLQIISTHLLWIERAVSLQTGVMV